MSMYTTVAKVVERIGRSNLNTEDTIEVPEEELTYLSGINTYALSMDPVNAITQVTGTVSSLPHTFVLDTDYKLTGDSIEWITSGSTPTGTVPDNGTVFYVTYSYVDILHAIEGYIIDVSAFIEEVTGKTYGNGGATPGLVPGLVEAAATDLACAYTLLRVSGSASSTTAGMAYELGKLRVDNKSAIKSAEIEKEVYIYLNRAQKYLDLLLKAPGEEGAPGSAPHTLRSSRGKYHSAPDPFTGAQRLNTGTYIFGNPEV